LAVATSIEWDFLLLLLRSERLLVDTANQQDRSIAISRATRDGEGKRALAVLAASIPASTRASAATK
jgi:hypothetical protein